MYTVQGSCIKDDCKPAIQFCQLNLTVYKNGVHFFHR